MFDNESIKKDIDNGLSISRIANKNECSRQYVRWVKNKTNQEPFEMFDTFDNSDYKYIKEIRFKQAKLAEAKAELKYLDKKH